MSTTKARDDEPFDFNLDAVKVEKTLRSFRFHYGGKRWEMTHREKLNQIPILEAIESAGEHAAILTVLRAALGDEQWQRLSRLGLVGEQLNKLSEAYNEFCGTDEGESEGSTGS